MNQLFLYKTVTINNKYAVQNDLKTKSFHQKSGRLYHDLKTFFVGTYISGLYI